MAAYWQGYGTLGVGEAAGSSMSWDSRALSLQASAEGERGGRSEAASPAENIPAGQVRASRRTEKNSSKFLASFVGQGEMPYQVRRRAREREEEERRKAHLQECVDHLQVSEHWGE